MRIRSYAWVAAIVVLGCGAELETIRIPPPPLMPPVSSQTPAEPPQPQAPNADRSFEKLAAGFLARYLEMSPVHATQLGEHRYDSRWPLLGAEGEKLERAFVARTRKMLDSIALDKLEAKNRVDAMILRNQLDQWTFFLDELREWETDPLFYTGMIGDGLDPLVSRETGGQQERLTNLGARLAGIPAIVQAAKASLKRPPKLHTETAIQQNDGLIRLVDKELPALFAKAPELKGDLEKRAAFALKALRELDEFLKKDLLKRSDGDFRLGQARFAKKLRYYLEADIPAEELYKSAQALLASTQDDMVQTSLSLWPELFPKEKVPPHDSHADKLKLVRKVLDAVAKDRPTNATIVDEARKLTQDATEFVRKNDLVELPSEPISVIVMPEYRRGIAIAYCDSSGPFEKNAMTFFAISPTPADWSRKRAESFYREYNRAMLADLTVHEAMPGHYLQLMHANRFKSDIRAAFGSGAFIEGWATYAEWLMGKYGFGGLRTRLQLQKMDLRMAANAMLDHDIHAGSMDEKAAMRLMTEEAFQEDGEAAGKWRRARLTSAQLSTYLYGYTELRNMRDRAEKQAGFTERTYHDRLLSFGSPAPKYVRHMMFGDAI
jgi:uncharacterized protein (DUF885 family)